MAKIPVTVCLALACAGCFSGGPLGENGGGTGTAGHDGGRTGTGSDATTSKTDAKKSGHDAGGPSTPTCAIPFSTDTPSTYVAKVKNLLIGLPPTASEVSQVAADGTGAAFASLVNTWMTGSQSEADGGPSYATLYQTKMLRFFELAFQQTQVAQQDFENQLNAGQMQFDGNRTTSPLLLQNQEEMFARTMLSLDEAGKPFNEAATTTEYMLTTAMKAYLGMTDVWQVNDGINGSIDAFQTKYPTQTLTVTKAGTNDPATFKFVDPQLVIAGTGCGGQLEYAGRSPNLWNIVVGFYPADNNGCTGTGSGQLNAAAGGTNDFNDWTMVQMGQPAAGGGPFAFWDVATLRTATSLNLNRPYVGFFTTPAYFANWPSNSSNQMRVTTNQALIVATGKQTDGTDTTSPNVDAAAYGLQTEHATAGSPCFNCHWLLDPTREVFANTFSWYYGYGLQVDGGGAGKLKDGSVGLDFLDQPAYFVFQGVQGPVNTTLAEFGSQLAGHPLFASGWPEKLCYYVNSGACNPNDPAFQAVVKVFQSSSAGSYSWSQLVAALVTSPVTTHAEKTGSVTGMGDAGGNCEPVAVSRRDHLCAALNARLGFQDICGLNASLTPILTKNALAIMPGLPSDGYGRGSTVPVLPNAPSLFYRTATENFCSYLSQVVVDNKTPPVGAKIWSSTGCTATANGCEPIGSNCTTGDGGTCQTPGDFVTIVAGLPSTDPRAGPLAGALFAHFQAALADADAGTNGKAPTATEALESAFIAACIAPSAVSIGL